MAAASPNRQILLRLKHVEKDIVEIKAALSQVETVNDSIQNHMQDFKLSIAKLADSVDRFRSVEVEIRALSDKLIIYEGKFKSIEELKGLVIATMLAVIPASIGVIFELAKTYLSAH